METIREFCAQVLGAGDLATKLAPPPRALADPHAKPIEVGAPARDPGIALFGGAPRLPRPGLLGEPAARAACLARFAHHELMAVELFAWALLRWPDVDADLRRGWLRVLSDEQRHARLYLARLEAHGRSLESGDCSDYFWKHVPAIAASPHGPLAFLSAMGLTLEQANLDFSAAYRDGFRAAGDEASALVCETVHRDEVGHVRLAAVWLARLAPEGLDDVTAFAETVPFPLSASRAKGRNFDRAAREAAGLSDRFIEYVRTARSSAERARPTSRPRE